MKPCAVCSSKSRPAIEEELRGKKPLLQIAEECGIGRMALARHRDNHMGRDVPAPAPKAEPVTLPADYDVYEDVALTLAMVRRICGDITRDVAQGNMAGALRNALAVRRELKDAVTLIRSVERKETELRRLTFDESDVLRVASMSLDELELAWVDALERIRAEKRECDARRKAGNRS